MMQVNVAKTDLPLQSHKVGELSLTSEQKPINKILNKEKMSSLSLFAFTLCTIAYNLRGLLGMMQVSATKIDLLLQFPPLNLSRSVYSLVFFCDLDGSDYVYLVLSSFNVNKSTIPVASF